MLDRVGSTIREPERDLCQREVAPTGTGPRGAELEAEGKRVRGAYAL